jgi:hypothetical protein
MYTILVLGNFYPLFRLDNTAKNVFLLNMILKNVSSFTTHKKIRHSVVPPFRHYEILAKFFLTYELILIKISMNLSFIKTQISQKMKYDLKDHRGLGTFIL